MGVLLWKQERKQVRVPRYVKDDPFLCAFSEINHEASSYGWTSIYGNMVGSVRGGKNQLTYPDVRSDDVVHSTYYNVLHDAEIDGKRCVFEEKAERMLIPKGKDQTKGVGQENRGKTEYVTDVRFSIHFDCVHAVCTEGRGRMRAMRRAISSGTCYCRRRSRP